MAVSADAPEDSLEFAEDYAIVVPLLSDKSLEVISAYGVAMDGRDIAVPSVFIIETAGKIHWRFVGGSMTDRPDPDEILRELPVRDVPP